MIAKSGKEVVSADPNGSGVTSDPTGNKDLIFLRRAEVQRATGLPTSTLYDLMQRGQFPKPVPLSPGRVGWIESEVRTWQLARIAERDAKQSEAA